MFHCKFMTYLFTDLLQIWKYFRDKVLFQNCAIEQLNSLRPGQNGRHFPDDHLKCIFLNGNAWISLKISLKFVPKVRINNIPALVQIMAWRRPGDKPLSEPMMVSLLTHICVTRPQWVNKDSIIFPDISSLMFLPGSQFLCCQVGHSCWYQRLLCYLFQIR